MAAVEGIKAFLGKLLNHIFLSGPILRAKSEGLPGLAVQIAAVQTEI